MQTGGAGSETHAVVGLMIARVLALAKNSANYAFVGSRESGYSFAFEIDSPPKIRQVCNRDGVKIYKVDAP